MDRIGVLLFDGEDLSIHVTPAPANGTPTVQLYDSDGLPYATFSAHLPNIQLQPDEVLVKTWSENADLREPMLATGLFVDTGGRLPLGHITAEVWRVIKPH
jgi:hypothetical protein